MDSGAHVHEWVGERRALLSASARRGTKACGMRMQSPMYVTRTSATTGAEVMRSNCSTLGHGIGRVTQSQLA